MLLYKEERQQYKEVIADNVSPSGVYGAEHLLRLFGKLKSVFLDNLTYIFFRWYIVDILVWYLAD